MARHRIVVLLLDQVLPLDFAIPMHVFAREAPEFYDGEDSDSRWRPGGISRRAELVPGWRHRDFCAGGHGHGPRLGRRASTPPPTR